MNPLINQLITLGLDRDEATIYRHLLEQGEQSAGRIAKATNVTRPTTYRLLTKLAVKGLVDEVKKKNKHYYRPHNPKQLNQLLKEESFELERRVNLFKKISPNLSQLYLANVPESSATFYQGPDAAVNVFRDQISEKNYEKLVITNLERTYASLPEGYLQNYEGQKVAANITTRVIAPDTQTDRALLKKAYQHLPKKYQAQATFIPQDKIPFQGEVNIYGNNKVSVINHDERQPISIIVTDKTLHNMLRMIFDLLWESQATKEQYPYKIKG